MDFSDYIASFVVAIIIAHFGSKGNRTRWIAASCILMGLESMLFAFPFFTYEIIIPGRQSIGEILFSNILSCTKSIFI
jgi:organic anion transporter 6A